MYEITENEVKGSDMTFRSMRNRFARKRKGFQGNKAKRRKVTDRSPSHSQNEGSQQHVAESRGMVDETSETSKNIYSGLVNKSAE